jgi:1,2-diacylglycerol 3-alpha-glucosyltransferase/glucuronosyltransferase
MRSSRSCSRKAPSAPANSAERMDEALKRETRALSGLKPQEDLDPGPPITARSLRILIATDAWYPQVNGVVRTLDTISAELQKMGHVVRILEPRRFRTLPLPSYPEIRVALSPARKAARFIEAFGPDAIHIATEGPIGWAVRAYCLNNKLPFTTSFHTRFPEYLHARTRLPVHWSYNVLRSFHWPAAALLASTPTLRSELEARGFRNIRIWSRGVDTELFRPRTKDFLDLPRPVSLYVGRVAVEKNLEAFLALDLPGTKLVVGEGPQLAQLKARYPGAVFVGAKQGEELARYYAAADVFVFPSRTDTFGLVVLEALASGVPVAAYPVQGPADILGAAQMPVGALDEDLRAAVLRALDCDPKDCRAFALTYSWENCARQFLGHLEAREVYARRRRLLKLMRRLRRRRARAERG